MEELFVSYEIAKALKEKGFNNPCFGWWCLVGDGIPSLNIEQSNRSNFQPDWDKTFLAPTHQQIIDWLREKHDLPIHIHSIWQHDSNNYSYQYHITANHEEWNGTEHYKSFNEALNNAIEEAVKRIN